MVQFVCKSHSGIFLYQIESALPTLARPIMSLDANEDAVVGALKQSLVKPFSSFISVPIFYFLNVFSIYNACDYDSVYHPLHLSLSLFSLFTLLIFLILSLYAYAYCNEQTIRF
jgi:hypothetical protein